MQNILEAFLQNYRAHRISPKLTSVKTHITSVFKMHLHTHWRNVWCVIYVRCQKETYVLVVNLLAWGTIWFYETGKISCGFLPGCFGGVLASQCNLCIFLHTYIILLFLILPLSLCLLISDYLSLYLFLCLNLSLCLCPSPLLFLFVR